jgi:hypothetical protein
MIGLDASVVVELVVGGPLTSTIRDELDMKNEPMIVPHLLDVEVVNAVRNLTAGKPV